MFGTHGQLNTSSAIRLAKRLERYEPLWFEETQIQLIDGYYALRLGEQRDLADVFDGQPRHLGISVNHGAELQPRLPLVSVPYALTAQNAVGDTARVILSGFSYKRMKKYPLEKEAFELETEFAKHAWL